MLYGIVTIITAVNTGGCFHLLAILDMQYNGAIYANNIEENKMKIRQAPQNGYERFICGWSGNYFIPSRGLRRYRMTCPTLYSLPCSAERRSDTQCQHSECTETLIGLVGIYLLL
jgi:hypothetical protein